MEWGYVIIAALFVLGVVLAFPLAIGICLVASGVLVGIDWFTTRCPGFRQVRRRLRRRRYRPGQVVTQFLAPDVRRDVEVIDASQIDAGVITARVRTWNVLYAARGLAPVPPFAEARAVEFRHLWAWSGAPWGGTVPEQVVPDAELVAAPDAGRGKR
jgi:hypothetical protein